VGSRVLTWHDIDLRCAKDRLKALRARDLEMSAVISVDDAPGEPNDALLDLIAPLAARARATTLPLLRERQAPSFVHVWPGEHYRLLAALVQETQPRTILEIGTCQGLSALAMLPLLRPDASLTTFDLLAWDRFPGTLLRQDDFGDSRFRQIVDDLSDIAAAERHAPLLQRADLLFVDAAKDGHLEQTLLDNFARVGLKTGALVVMDDIRFWNMLAIWRRIKRPKLDVMTLGHYSGTGLVWWTP